MDGSRRRCRAYELRVEIAEVARYLSHFQFNGVCQQKGKSFTIDVPPYPPAPAPTTLEKITGAFSGIFSR